jgi:phage terminase large subunit GpA-like protein
VQIDEARQIIAQYLPQYVATRRDHVKSLAEWAVSTPVILDGKPFAFERHEYLVEPYNDTHPNQVELKATQLGLTTRALLRALYAARYRKFKGILYLFPSKTDVLDFSKSRVGPLIEDNPDTIGTWVKDTDAAGIKQIQNTFLYLRGMVSRVGLKSAPADMIIFDELDEAPQNAVDMAFERLAHSEYKEVHKLSNPTLPDYGIDKAFQATDQRYWLLKCEGCGHYNCLEDIFMAVKPPEVPKCFKVRTDGEIILACEKCHKALNPSIGVGA